MYKTWSEVIASSFVSKSREKIDDIIGVCAALKTEKMK